MPDKMHKALEKEARKKFGNTTSERARGYIYGPLMRHEKSQGRGGKKGK